MLWDFFLYSTLSYYKNTHMNKSPIYSLFFILTSILFIGCASDDEESRQGGLPVAKGTRGEIILVMDSLQWHTDLGEAIRATFEAPLDGLPRNEAAFKLRYINPFQLTSILKTSHNLIFVTILDDQSNAGRKLKSYFTKESLERVRDNPNLFMLTKKDDFARGQETLHLFGNNANELVENLGENQEKLRNHFLEIEKKRLKSKMYKAQERKSVTNKMRSDHDFEIRIPAGYQLAKNDENFAWIREIDKEVDKSLVVYYENYEDEAAFDKDQILAMRDRMSKKYLRDPDKASIHMDIQTVYPVAENQVNFNNKYAKEIRGLWKLSDNSRGGPFLAYAVVDEALNRIYYIEGYLDSPGQEHRNVMIELETILWTFQTSAEGKATAAKTPEA